MIRTGRLIQTPGRNCLDIFDEEAHGLFIDARDYYLAFAGAARQARRYILIAGWRFDSEVRLFHDPLCMTSAIYAVFPEKLESRFDDACLTK